MPRFEPDYMRTRPISAKDIKGPFDDFRDPNATAAEKEFEKLDAQGVRWVVERAMATHEQKNAADQYQQDYKTFLHMYPAYVDSSHNAKLMQHNWKQAFGVECPTLEQMEESFFALRASGVLTLNQKAVAKEDAATIAQRADEVIATRKEREFNEDAADEMSLETLRLRAQGIWE